MEFGHHNTSFGRLTKKAQQRHCHTHRHPLKLYTDAMDLKGVTSAISALGFTQICCNNGGSHGVVHSFIVSHQTTSKPFDTHQLGASPLHSSLYQSWPLHTYFANTLSHTHRARVSLPHTLVFTSCVTLDLANLSYNCLSHPNSLLTTHIFTAPKVLSHSPTHLHTHLPMPTPAGVLFFPEQFSRRNNRASSGLVFPVKQSPHRQPHFLLPVPSSVRVQDA